MRIAVTGAYGFSGKYIARRLLDLSHEVITLTNSPHRANLFGESIKAFPYDFSQPQCLHLSALSMSKKTSGRHTPVPLPSSCSSRALPLDRPHRQVRLVLSGPAKKRPGGLRSFRPLLRVRCQHPPRVRVLRKCRPPSKPVSTTITSA